MRLLIVEDEIKTGDYLKQGLTEAGFQVSLVRNGLDGHHLAMTESFELVILDVMLPQVDGFEIARKLREKNTEIPILFLTAKSMKEDAIKGFKVGADDYLNKPFDSEVLLMKIKAIMQRKATDSLADSKQFEFTIGDFHLNSKLRFLTFKDDQPIKLSPKENELLRLLALHENDLMPRELALTKIWRDDNYFTSRSMDVYIAKLRKYLKVDPNVEILNIHGEGFRLVVNKD